MLKIRSIREKLILAIFVFAILGFHGALSVEYREKNQYLGVINGQISGNSVVKVSRTPSEPSLYMSNNFQLPKKLIIPNADFRSSTENMLFITVKQYEQGLGEARATMQVSLMVDGKKVSPAANQQGEDVVITVPNASKKVELRTDNPIELELPVSFRGHIQIPVMVIEG